MGSGLYGVNGWAGGPKLDSELVVDLALSVDGAAMWRWDLPTEALTWMPKMVQILGMAGSDEQRVHERLAELISPLTSAARSAPVWQDFALEQRFDALDGTGRCVQFRARMSPAPDTPGLYGIATDVTSRHERQVALTDLADRYRLLVELSPDAIAVHEGGRLVYANPAVVRFLGAASATELVGHRISEFVHPDSVVDMRQRIEGLTTAGATSAPSDAALLRLDGGIVGVEAVSVRTTWEGRPAFQVIMRDVTVQNAAAATLRYQAALVTHVSDAIIATTADGVVTSWNPGAEAVYGRTSAEAIGRPVREVVGAALDPKAVLAAGGVSQGDHRRPDGSALAVRVSAAQMDDGYVLMCADETARRRAEQHFATVVAALQEGVIVVGPTGLVASVNPAAERILGVRHGRLIGVSTALADLYDENGVPVPDGEYPSQRARRTGVPDNGRIVHVRRADGSRIWLSLSARALPPDGDRPPSVVISFTDITERRLIDARLEQDATHDALTGLANRTVAINRLSLAARRHAPGLTAVLYIDLDKFKVINDSLGHSVGDRVLTIMGARLRRRVGRDDLVGRLGGDEFAVVARGVRYRADAVAIAERLRDTVSQPLTVDGRHLHVDASIGIVLADQDDPRDGEELLRDADLAMYEAKTQGRDRYAFFDVELRERTQRRLHLEQDLRHAPGNGQLWVAYQPIVDLRTGRTATVEGLLRWEHPRYGALSPGEFIPLAEEGSLINLIGAHMLRTAVAEIVAFRAERDPDLGLAVNLSARQLEDPLLPQNVRRALDAAGLPASALYLEVTESAVMRDPQVAARVLVALRELGVRLAIDDFGTGYSSLAQLLRLPLDTLKIDQSFTAELGESEDARAIVTSIIAMAHAVGLTVIAEGVETEAQLDILRELDCDHVQGYHLARPTALANLWPTPRTPARPATGGRAVR